jgi:hypothetical protein
MPYNQIEHSDEPAPKFIIIYRAFPDRADTVMRLLGEAGFSPEMLDDPTLYVRGRSSIRIAVPPEEADAAHDLLAKWNVHHQPAVEGITREIHANVILALILAAIIIGIVGLVLGFTGGLIGWFFGAWGLAFVIISNMGGRRQE